MCSFEDRMRAVELYIKYGHCAADMIREPGYPNRGSLRNWFREFEESGDLHAGKVRPRSFSDERVRAAVDHNLEHGRPLARTVRAMGYPKSGATLAAWVDELVLASIHFSPFRPVFFRQTRHRVSAGRATVDAPLPASPCPPSRRRRRATRLSSGRTALLSL